MSNWTDFRNSLIEALHVNEVTEEIKQDVTKTIVTEVLPPIEDVLKDFCKKIREQAPTESGWCRIRDGIVLPLVMESIIYIIKYVLNKTLRA
jgi:hypothetical protein